MHGKIDWLVVTATTEDGVPQDITKVCYIFCLTTFSGGQGDGSIPVAVANYNGNNALG